MNALTLVGIATNVAMVWMALAWIFARRADNAGWVDVAWSYAFTVATILLCALGPAPADRKLLLIALVAGWSLRLGTYLVWRVGRHPEDPRYAQLREQFPQRPWLMFFGVFQAQAVLVGILCTPFAIVAANTSHTFSIWEAVGAAVWVVGLAGESIADSQLAAFKRDPANRGMVCDVGLWRYSRHPNYFFEWVIWVGFGLLALGAPHGWLGLMSPIIMYYLLTRVTGIPPAEAGSLKSRGDAYREYQKTTSPFFPMPPK
ncbi:MAG: DUF1295 domain-containing protein [Terrimicrobiaceae bacterium]